MILLPTLKRLWLVLSILGLALPAFAQTASLPSEFGGTPATRPITVRDMIEMSKLADPTYFRGGSPPQGRVGSFSPDRSRFIIVTEKGDLAANTNTCRMLLWNSADALRGNGAPRKLLEMTSSSIRNAIDGSSIVWAPDNETITFIGENVGEEQQVFSLNTRTGTLKRLTEHATSVRSLSFDASQSRMAYIAEHAYEELWNNDTRKSGIVVDEQFLADLMTGRNGYRYRGRPYEFDLFLQDKDGTRPLHFNRKLELWSAGSGPWLSPDGERVIAVTRVPNREVLPHWSEYRDVILQKSLDYQNSGGHGHSDESTFLSYEMIEARTGRSRVLLNAPISRPSPVVWSPNSASVVLSGVFLPLDVSDARERDERAQRAFTVEIDVTSGEITRVGERCQQAVRWDAVTKELTCMAEATGSGDAIDKPLPLVQFAKDGKQWREVSSRPPQPGDLVEVVLREDMNMTPKLYVRRSGEKNEILFWDLNPQFRDLRFAKVEEVSWEWAKGQRASGGLYYPLDYRPGQRYPLVIQTHAWNRNRFWIDGPWTTAYAAQALATRGIAVLQLDDGYFPDRFGADGQRREVEKALSIYRSAISFLDGRGLIDVRRVGIIGFSHTCFYVKYALAHAPSLFAAASIAEGEDGGYFRYMTGANNYVDENSLYGGPPVGPHLQEWLRLAPGFNLHQVQTPVWINSLNPRFLLGDWEWFDGLRLLHKPVEMVMLEDEQHIVKKPANRMISQGGNVDWFDFWLNGHEDPDPAKSKQYSRWRQLRKLHEDNAQKRKTDPPSSKN